MTSERSQDLHNRGWGFALVIIFIAIAANLSVFLYHQANYLQPKSGAPTAGAAH